MEFKPRLKVWQGSNRKNTFNPETNEATSYSHWTYVRKVKGKWIFNDYNYSVTTNKHQSEMRHFLRTVLKVKPQDILFVNQRASLDRGIDLTWHYERLFLAEMRLQSKGRRADFYKGNQETVKRMKRTIKLLQSRGAMTKTDGDIEMIRKRVIAEEQDRLEEQRIRSKEQREKAKQLKQTFDKEFNSLDNVSI